MLVVGLLASGCSGGEAEGDSDAPSDSSSSSSSSVSSATEDATETYPEPEYPDLAREDSDEGAVAFVTYWVEMLNYASKSGDFEALRELNSPDCEFCETALETPIANFDAGYRWPDTNVGGIASIAAPDSVAPDYVQPEADAAVEGVISFTPQELLDSAGAVEHSSPEQQAPVTFDLVRESEAWVVREIRFVA